MRGVRKKGVSPVIATILLIALVFVISMIVFLFMRGLNEESITKFGNENIKLACQRVDFEASYSGTELAISNLGIPIYDMNIKLDKGDSYETKGLKKDYEGWPQSGLGQGDIISIDLSDIAGLKKIIITPVLVGKTKEGAKKSYSCDQGLYKNEIII